MHTVNAAMVRIAVLGAALAGYYAALPFLFPDDGGGANIGAGLIAFAGLALMSFGWALQDGRARGNSSTVTVWSIVAVVMGIGWFVALAVAEADASMSVADRIETYAFIMFFTVGLVFGPAAAGVGVGSALRPSSSR
ncbi:hypothetical protein [Nocardioides sp.]|uniref:hypothetical protein n=1 Tax=Nocardioides sp. TaxID=35761 RepID=UPI002BBD4C6D|nr:hypothetical protein [Nocardioides sp.]HXH77803.1 hypothetical protein [Nocardioides sp.]